MNHATVVLRSAVLVCAAALSAIDALAAITPLSMDMLARSKTCITPCLLNSSYTVDQDQDPDNFGSSFANLSVATSVAAGVNALAASASGTTTLNGTTGFTVHLVVDRPSTAQTTGSYETLAQTRFQFITDGAAGALDIAYSVGYTRPMDGSTLGTGVGFGAPLLLQIVGGQSVFPTTFQSLGGVVAGQWHYTLDPNTYYEVTLAAANATAFSSPLGLGQDSLNATYTVTLPSFAAPVPEPSDWAMILAGLGLMSWTIRRRRITQAA